MDDEFWLPLVDEPIGELVRRVQEHDEELAALVAAPERQLAFRTFAYLRVGLVLGEMLVDADVETRAADPGAWVTTVLADPANAERIRAEIRAVAREVAADPKLAGAESAPDPEARARVRRFVRDTLGS